MQLLLSSLAAICFTLGGAFMKQADGMSGARETAAYLVLFAAGAIAQSFAMRGAPMSLTYVLVLALEGALAVGFGVWFFGEHLTPLKLGGVALIVAGIAIVRGQ